MCAQPLKRVGSSSSTAQSRQNSVTKRSDVPTPLSVGPENPFAEDMKAAFGPGARQPSPGLSPAVAGDRSVSRGSSSSSACGGESRDSKVTPEELARQQNKAIHPALMKQAFFRKYEAEEINVAKWVDSMMRIGQLWDSGHA